MKHKKKSYLYGGLIALIFSTMLAACGDTPTTAPAATTSEVTTAASTTTAATTAAGTTATGTSAAATTLAATTAGSTTAAGTTIAATTAANTTTAVTTVVATTSPVTTVAGTTMAATTNAATAVATTAPPTAAGQLIIQIQVPTTAGKAPSIENFQGESYFNVQITSGETIQLVPASGFKWIKSEAREDSQTLGVINYFLYGEITSGPIVVQAQVPTTDDKAPSLEVYRGERYFNIQTTQGNSIQVIAVAGLNWTGSKYNPDSTTPGVLNYYLNGDPGATTAVTATTAPASAATTAASGTTTSAATTAATSATTAAATTAVTTASATTAAQSQVTCAKQYADEIAKFQDAVIKEIQTEREEATQKDGIARPALNWNAQLACQSQEWAQALSTNTFRQNPHCCSFGSEHSDLYTWSTGNAEGLAMGANTAVGGVQQWRTGEMKFFDFSASEAAKRKDHPCFQGTVCGHYGAIVGLFTLDVGCGFFLDPTGGNRNYTACQYIFKYPRP